MRSVRLPARTTQFLQKAMHVIHGSALPARPLCRHSDWLVLLSFALGTVTLGFAYLAYEVARGLV